MINRRSLIKAALGLSALAVMPAMAAKERLFGRIESFRFIEKTTISPVDGYYTVFVHSEAEKIIREAMA